MIVRCYSCGKRVSDQMDVCPHCQSALTELTREQRAELVRRRLQTRLFRARTATHLAMLMVLAGLLWWWLGGEPMVLDRPAPTIPVSLAALGLLVYLVGWGWMLYVRFELRRRR